MPGRDSDCRQALFRRIAGLLLTVNCWFVPPGSGAESEPEILQVGAFSALATGDELPEPWQPLKFENIPRATQYRLVRDVVDGTERTVLEALSVRSASGLTRRLDVDPQAYPLLRWRWKVPRALAGSALSKRSGDDFAARIYVTFAVADDIDLWERLRISLLKVLYGKKPPGRALNYVWAADESIGRSAPSPYTDRVHTIVAESGSVNLNAWIEEVHNVYDDYRKAFERKPPRITGVALMTDTDNTGDSGRAFFGDIWFLSER